MISILGDNTYYVSSSTTSDCPQPCHPLSHYINDTATYFTSNTTFIFMEGEHLLDIKGVIQVQISNADNLTLKGEGEYSNTHTIMRCSSNTHGLEFRNGSVIIIYGITITGCDHRYALNVLIPSGGFYIVNYKHIIIANSTFTNNTFKFGSAVYILCDTNTEHNIVITDSTFTNNKVDDYGSALLIHGNTAKSNVTIANSVFSKNTIIGSGGGLALQFNINDNYNLTITNSEFANNEVNGFGGGLYVYSGADAHNDISIANSIFTNNTVGFGCGLTIMYYSIAQNEIVITNSNFTYNSICGLTITFAGHNNDCKVLLSQATISHNNGTGVVVIGPCTAVFTKGHSIIANNSSPTDAGGIYLDKDSHLTTSNGGHVSFINNTANRYGGAIYCYGSDHMTQFAEFNEHINIRPNHGDPCTVYDHNISATFINNSAIRAGDQLYGGTFLYCQGNSYGVHKSSVLHCSGVPDTAKHTSSAHPLSPVSSDPLLVCPCINGTVNCTVRSLDRELYPGQILDVSLVTVGLCGGVSPGTVDVQHHDGINLISSTINGYTSTSCTVLNYTVKVTAYITNPTLIFNVPDGDSYNIEPVTLNFTILPCPLGLVVNYTSGDCVCDEDFNHIPGVLCNISWMPHPIQRSGNNWISHQYDTYNCTIAHTGCPFDYCNTSPVKFALNQSDLQCNYNRSGILCGQCIQGLSLMIGSNRCANCTDTALISASIVIIAAVAGIVLVIILLVLNLTVSVGYVNGVLFYANIVKLNESILFSQGNIPVISQFISWCNLDLGIEYCFLDGLDGYVKTWLQFVFPLYVWFLVILIIVGCQYSSRLTRLCGRNAVPVLATLILMSYTKLSRTVTNALMMNTLQCGEYKWNVWNVDGNIDYLGRKHTVLLTVSLLFLVTGLVYTGLVFSSQWLQRYSGKCCKSTRDPVVRLKPLIDAYTGPFKDRYRFWTGLCLMVRLMLTVVFSFTTTLQSKLNNYIVQLTVGVMSILVVGGGVYKDSHLTVLETVSHVNLVCLSSMAILFSDESYRDMVSIDAIVSISVSIEMLLFVTIVTVHCYFIFKKALPNSTSGCNCITRATSHELAPTSYDVDEEGSPAHIINCRDEIIFDFHLN